MKTKTFLDDLLYHGKESGGEIATLFNTNIVLAAEVVRKGGKNFSLEIDCDTKEISVLFEGKREGYLSYYAIH